MENRNYENRNYGNRNYGNNRNFENRNYENRGNYDNSNNFEKREVVYSQKLRAGRKRTYFFDVKTTRANDYFLTITESKKRPDGNGYDRHKIFLYKEDFNKFIEHLTATIDHVKTQLMPTYDFDEFHRDREARMKEGKFDDDENYGDDDDEKGYSRRGQSSSEDDMKF